jgi:nicotinate-nucleotide adenylyltransferase
MRLALFGGTFDPIHNAHLTVAREAAAQFHLDQVWFVPAAHPPHKSDQTGASYEDRFLMTELACRVDPRFVASRLEAGASKSYSVDTVERVRALGEQPYFIIGADAFAEIASWHRWQDMVRTTEFIVVTRPGHQYAAPPGARVHRLETVALPVSSSEIRKKLAGGEVTAELPTAVGHYILEHGLYQVALGHAEPLGPRSTTI